MPRIRLTKSAIDALPTPKSDVVYWDAGCAGFGVKVTPKGRKVFIVLYRTAGAGSRLRKYTIGPYGRVTLHQARVAAQRVFTARLEGRDPAGEKREAKRRIVADRVEDILETFIAQRLSQNKSGDETARLLRRELKPWIGKSIHEIKKREREARQPVAPVPDRRHTSWQRFMLIGANGFVTGLRRSDALAAATFANAVCAHPCIIVHRCFPT